MYRAIVEGARASTVERRAELVGHLVAARVALGRRSWTGDVEGHAYELHARLLSLIEVTSGARDTQEVRRLELRCLDPLAEAREMLDAPVGTGR